jgi:hypothetical protein
LNDQKLVQDDLSTRRGGGEGGVGGGGEEGYVGEPGRVWRVRWKNAVRRGKERFRAKVCEVTGLLCQVEKP